jgi:biofilm PGA synthesis N-glycosyltransferase PgaC
LILVSNIILALAGVPIYQVILCFQVFFYVVALAGYVLRGRKVAIKGFFVPFYFTFMNLAVYAGFFRFMKGRQSVMWEKAARAEKA